MPLLRIKEVAQILKVSPQTVLNLITDRKIGSILVGKRSRIDSADLARYLQTNHVTVTQTATTEA